MKHPKRHAAHPLGNLGHYAHPKKATPHSLVSPKQENPKGPMHAQVGKMKPDSMSTHRKGKRY